METCIKVYVPVHVSVHVHVPHYNMSLCDRVFELYIEPICA